MANRTLTVNDLKKMKIEKKTIAMITAYDYPSAKLAESAGADIIFIGDTLGMVVLGYDSTVFVTMEDMIHHSKAVVRGVTSSFVLADMPFASYHGSIDRTINHAARLIQEGGVKALKLEGGREISDAVRACVNVGIPIMGHIGLTPQAVNQIGGYKLQGRDTIQASKLIDDAKALEQAGAFSLVLEMVPEELAQYISEQLSIPVIGIGAGRGTDGQVLVYHDILQYASSLKPKFVKNYANIGETIEQAIASYIHEVKNHQFPGEQHVFHMEPKIMEEIKRSVQDNGKETQHESD